MFNDIVFEGRNKLYGAYYLRHRQDRYMLFAMLAAIMITIGAVNSPNLIRLLKGFFPQPPVEEFYTTHCLMDPPPMTSRIKPAPALPATPNHAPRNAQVAFVTPAVVDDDEAINDDLPPEIGDLDGKTIGTQNVEGETGTGEVYPVDTLSSSGIGTEPEVIDAPFAYVAQMPEFPGGEQMLFAFLRDNMKYPVFARENQIEGRVVMQFIVSKEGVIQDVKVLKGIGGGCDQEALRVVKSMPVWRPGKHNGREVPVTFTLPIVFDLK